MQKLNIFCNRFLKNFAIYKFISKQNYCEISTKTGIKVTVLGASGGIGQPLTLMLKQSPLFDEISLYDVMDTHGLAMELNCIDTCSVVTSHEGPDGLINSLKDSNIVLMVAGIPRRIGMSRADLFEANAATCANLSEACARTCPNAFLCIVTNPVNSMLPVTFEIFTKINRVVDAAKIFGITTLDTVRACSFISDKMHLPPETIDLPIIGGHSGNTIIPILSQIKPSIKLNTDEIVGITRAVQEAGDEVVKAKKNTGSATLSMAFAAMRFAVSLAKAIKGVSNIIENSYVSSNIIPEVPYMANQILLGPNGLQKNYGIPNLTEFESCLLEIALPVLKTDISKGIDFVQTMNK